MDKNKIQRINELARKKKSIGLTEAEEAEQAALRKEYLDGYRENLKAMLDRKRMEAVIRCTKKNSRRVHDKTMKL